MESRWVTSEFEPTGRHEDSPRKNVISLQPRLDAIRSHMSEQVTDLEGYVCKSIPVNHDNFSDTECFRVGQRSAHSPIPLHPNSMYRKCNRIARVSKILLEQLSDQLKTVSDLGDIVAILSPAVPILRSIRSSMIQCIPEFNQELSYISELIEVVLVDAAQLGGYSINFQTANQSAGQWISELNSKDYRANETA